MKNFQIAFIFFALLFFQPAKMAACDLFCWAAILDALTGGGGGEPEITVKEEPSDSVPKNMSSLGQQNVQPVSIPPDAAEQDSAKCQPNDFVPPFGGALSGGNPFGSFTNEYACKRSTDAFTMLGDSRTQFITAPPVGKNWDYNRFLGQYRNPSCSANQFTIQNLGSGGSRTDHWLAEIVAGNIKSGHMHNRVVIMLGGNDVLQLRGNWSGVPWQYRDQIMNGYLDEIHSRFKGIVTILRSWGKEVIVQKHFNAGRPGNAQSDAATAGLFGLNQKLHQTYSQGIVQTSPGFFYIIGWKQACTTLRFFRFRTRICIHLPVVRFRPPTFALNGGVPGVSLVEIGPFIDPAFFPADDAHLGDAGYQIHASYLKDGLHARCWW